MVLKEWQNNSYIQIIILISEQLMTTDEQESWKTPLCPSQVPQDANYAVSSILQPPGRTWDWAACLPCGLAGWSTLCQTYLEFAAGTHIFVPLTRHKIIFSFWKDAMRNLGVVQWFKSKVQASSTHDFGLGFDTDRNQIAFCLCSSI